MTGPWELWGTHPGNLICNFDAEGDALRMARQCIEDGWLAENLSLVNDDDSDDLAIWGDALLARITEVLG